MKVFVFFVVVLVVVLVVVTCAQVNTQKSTTVFFEDFKKFANSTIKWEQNPTNFETLPSKVNALYKTTYRYDVELRAYPSIMSILFKLSDLDNQMGTTADAFKQIRNNTILIDAIFDELNTQRDDEISEINILIDKFLNEYVESSVELFNLMLKRSEYLEDKAEELAYDINNAVTNFAEKIGNCVYIRKTEFKEIYQCHQKAREVYPSLAADYKKLVEIRRKGLEPLNSVKMDDKASFDDLLEKINTERSNLMKLIRTMKDQRKADEPNL